MGFHSVWLLLDTTLLAYFSKSWEAPFTWVYLSIVTGDLKRVKLVSNGKLVSPQASEYVLFWCTSLICLKEGCWTCRFRCSANLASHSHCDDDITVPDKSSDLTLRETTTTGSEKKWEMSPNVHQRIGRLVLQETSHIFSSTIGHDLELESLPSHLLLAGFKVQVFQWEKVSMDGSLLSLRMFSWNLTKVS